MIGSIAAIGLIIGGCSSGDSAERLASAVDACQRARSIGAPVPNPATSEADLEQIRLAVAALLERTEATSSGLPPWVYGTGAQSLSNIQAALDFLVDAEVAEQQQRRASGSRRNPLLTPFANDYVLPPAHVIVERTDAIRVALIRSGDQDLLAAFDTGVDALRNLCVEQGLIE